MAAVSQSAPAPLRVFLGGVSSQSGRAALTSLLAYPNVTVTASARDIKAVAESAQFKSAVDAKRVTFVAISTAGGVLRPKDDAKATVDLKGYDALLLVAPPALIGGRTEVGPAFANAAKAAALKHVVLLAVTPAESAHLKFNVDLAPFLALFKATSLPLTLIRVGWFYDNLFLDAPAIKATGAFYAPLTGDVKLPSLSVNDIGRAGAAVTVQGPAKHAGKDYSLFTEFLTYDELAAAAAKGTGKPVAFKTVTAEAYVKTLTGFGLPSAFAEGFADLYKHMQTGILNGAKSDLAALIAPTKPESAAEWFALPEIKARFAAAL